MTFLEALSLPDEFMHPERYLCGLCGNHGVVDMTGKVFSPAGVECGVKAFCVCPNGRALKRADALQKKRPKKPQTFWVSWNDYSWLEPARLGKNIICAWESGQAGDGSYATIVAWIAASTTSEVIAAVDRDYPCKGEREWRFIRPESNWTPPGDRFPLNKQALTKLKKLRIRKENKTK